MKIEYDKFIESAKKVERNSKSVKVNYKCLDDVIKLINKSDIKYWLDDNPFNILDDDTDRIIDTLLFLHTIGDYCFWGDPKWTIDVDGDKLDGSYAMMYLVCNYIKYNENFDMNFEQFKDFLKGNVEIPLLEDRYNNLLEMNKILAGNRFSDLIKNIDNDTELFEFIVRNFSYFEDKSIYDGVEVYFYKRAQLLVSDILHVKSVKEKITVDYGNLVGCADYKLPQVMRAYGILEYNKELENIVDSGILILADSEMENEIRASTLVVIDYMSKKLDIPRMDINDYIWLLGQDKEKMTKPYHKTITNKY